MGKYIMTASIDGSDMTKYTMTGSIDGQVHNDW